MLFCADTRGMSSEDRPLLSAGVLRTFRRSRPQLAASSAGSPEPVRAVRPGSRRSVGGLVRFIASVFGLLLATGVGVWVVLTLTVLPTVSAGGSTWLVQRAADTVGRTPVGTTVLLMPEKIDRSFTARAKLLTGVDGAYVVKVIADPGSKISVSQTGKLLVDDTATTYVVPANLQAKVLGTQYAAECVTGPCGTPGSVVLVPVDNVLGTVVGKVSLSGITPVDKPKADTNGIGKE